MARGRALAAGQRSTLTLKEWREILKHWKKRCAYCGSIVRVSIDHKLAVSQGGDNVKENVVPACGSCNSSKLNHPLAEWLPKRIGVANAQKVLRCISHP